MTLMLPPGLLPENTESRRTLSPRLSFILALASMVALGGTLMQLRRVTQERDQALDRLSAPPAKVAESRPRPPAPVAPPPAPLPAAELPAPPPPALLPSRAPDLRISSSALEESQHIAQGLQEFRAGHYEQAERQLFRALPESILYLALCSLAEGNYREAFGFLSRAMSLDPNWLRKVKPSDLFGSGPGYQAALQGLEDQVSKEPLNADLKTLLAYLRFHDKGATYAQALLLEATAADPAQGEAKAFLKALEP